MSHHSLSLLVDLNEKDSFNRDSGVRVDDVVIRAEVLDEKRENGNELLLCELHSQLCPGRLDP